MGKIIFKKLKKLLAFLYLISHLKIKKKAKMPNKNLTTKTNK